MDDRKIYPRNFLPAGGVIPQVVGRGFGPLGHAGLAPFTPLQRSRLAPDSSVLLGYGLAYASGSSRARPQAAAAAPIRDVVVGRASPVAGAGARTRGSSRDDAQANARPAAASATRGSSETTSYEGPRPAAGAMAKALDETTAREYGVTRSIASAAGLAESAAREYVVESVLAKVFGSSRESGVEYAGPPSAGARGRGLSEATDREGGRPTVLVAARGVDHSADYARLGPARSIVRPSGLSFATSRSHKIIGGAAPWTPALLGTSLRAWFKADSLGLTDGAAVSYWADLSGNQFDLAMPFASQRPTFRTNVVNGLPIVRFDDDSPIYTNPKSMVNRPGFGVPAVNSQSQPLLIAVIANVSVPTTQFGLVQNYQGDSFVLGGTFFGGPVQYTLTMSAFTTPEGFKAVTYFMGTNWAAAVGGWRLVEAVCNTSNSDILLDGTSVNNGGTTTISNSGFNGIVLGNFLNADVLEVIITTDLSARQLIEGYADWRAGIQANLPSGHPYAGSPPTAPAPSILAYLRGSASAAGRAYGNERAVARAGGGYSRSASRTYFSHPIVVTPFFDIDFELEIEPIIQFSQMEIEPQMSFEVEVTPQLDFDLEVEEP